MATLTDRQFEDAEAHGREVLANEPAADSARYDRRSGRVVIELRNGCAYAFPAGLVQDLQGAGADDLAEIETDAVGLNLHWPTLDVDLYVAALVSGIFGTRKWMKTELARLAGSSKSPAKAAAARANGAKGGRPRKAVNG
ncbi:MAG: DUF2442 domain-containing protein [Mesorhizobium sp.]|nr:DUF2442 domain-containing protein [Mesorhizobium sp.]MBL8580051.1 DUF2442 domain-containing protein [Mesorhizobium sp.]